MMTLKSKLKVENFVVLVFSIFYAIAAGAEALILALSNFKLMTVGILGVLSLAASYGLLRMKKWSVLLIAILFFPEITFGMSTLYASIVVQTFYPSLEVLLFHLALIVYVTFCLFSFVYVVAKREAFR